MMFKNVKILVVAISILLAACSPLRTDSALQANVDEYLSENVANGFNGALLIAKKGKVVFNKGYGLANKEKMS